MKLHFEPDLEFQKNAIDSVCDLFRGQEICRSEFTVTMNTPADSQQGSLSYDLNALGIGNRLQLLDDDLLANLREIQTRNGLKPSDSLASGDFTVEMETGTGKTYVYLRTIFELNRRYGFTKFVIVVPSIAIKEGVYKTLQITKDHFGGLYGNATCEFFLYDSSRLDQVRNFATSPHIQVMVVTVQAIAAKAVALIYKDTEKTGGEKPIDLIRATSPILIVDEPQSVDGGISGKGKEALAEMWPLCTLRYSATHAAKHHMVFRLDAVDAYERKLVKQIEVASLEIDGGHNKPFVRFLSASNKRGVISAKVELDVQHLTHVSREVVTVYDGDDLEQTTRRALYANHLIGEIRCGKGDELLEVKIPGSENFLRPGQAVGDVDGNAVKRQMIRRTIKEHLDKELRLRPQGIKVLSLFFIDSVEKYRKGPHEKGDYAIWFEEEYKRLAAHPDYRTLFHEVDLSADATEVHEGYFSIDRKGGWTETAEGNAGDRENAERAYNLIMKDKERLLSLDTKLKFIFSHSALREGWDNPNVFQICALREMGGEQQRRQTIGRGLRLCVNQDGVRLRGFEINTLTVIATESYSAFAENLQKEIEADTGVRFGIVEEHQFALIPMREADGRITQLGLDRSKLLWLHLKDCGYINAQGRVQDQLKFALKDGTVDLPEAFKALTPEIMETLRKLAGKLEIKNADDRIQIKTRQAVLQSAEFKALWDRIKHKTTYRVQFDNEKLIVDCARALSDCQPVTKTRLRFRTVDLAIGRGGVIAGEERTTTPITLDEKDLELPDLLTELQDKTKLTRRSLLRILRESQRLPDFLRNPQQFIEYAIESINRTKRLALVDGIRYQRLGDNLYYAQELFEQEELTGYLKNTLAVTKAVYEQVVFDSAGVEKGFAEELEANESVKLYAKLPGWFKVPTPLGTYNPDWAVLIDRDGIERLYFVVETKGSLFADDLRDKEDAKIKCGVAHFAALSVESNPAKFIPRARNLDDVLKYCP
jgi:type III restriction enzyme